MKAIGRCAWEDHYDEISGGCGDEIWLTISNEP